MTAALLDRYQRFIELVREQRQLGYISSVLHWDEQTYLPPQGAAGRGEQISVLSRIIHERLTAPAFRELLESLRESRALNDDQQVCVREVAREVDRATKVPSALVGAISELESKTQHLWIAAREQEKFAMVANSLEQLIRLKQEYADCLRTGSTRYETLLDLYETGLTVAEVERWFAELRPALQSLLGRFAPRARRVRFPAEFPRAAQEALLQESLDLLGFDRRRGRLDSTVHPYCLDLGIDDIRLTTRYAADDFAVALYAALHEAGHGLYEQGFDRAHAYTPLALYSTMAVHESQSRLWENMVGRSAEFMALIYPRLNAHFPQALTGVSLDALLHHVNAVGPSLIRVEADEISYGLHVIIRFELERLLISGDLAVADLPAAWNGRYEEYLGIRPPGDREGALQDIHWYIGHYGYFPTYLIGSCYAAQLFAAIERDHPDVRQHIAGGKLAEIRDWLRHHVHRHGRRYLGNELIQRATGSAPGAQPYLTYLTTKYSSLP